MRCTQPMVQLGAQLFAVRNSRLTSSRGVFGERHAGVAALLRAVVHQAVFADIEVARAGAAAPVVGPALGDGFLELVERA